MPLLDLGISRMVGGGGGGGGGGGFVYFIMIRRNFAKCMGVSLDQLGTVIIWCANPY